MVLLVPVSGGTDGQVPQLPWVGEPDYGTGCSAEGGNLTVFEIQTLFVEKIQNIIITEFLDPANHIFRKYGPMYFYFMYICISHILLFV